MVEVIFKENKFLLKDTFNFGLVGTFENKEFEDYENDEIGIEDTL